VVGHPAAPRAPSLVGRQAQSGVFHWYIITQKFEKVDYKGLKTWLLGSIDVSLISFRKSGSEKIHKGFE